MKKMVYLLAIIFLLTLLSGCGAYSYESRNWVYVTYDEGAGRRVEKLNVDKDTFKVLKDKNYAKDKYKVFYQGYVIKDANPNTFEVINNEGYSKDDKYVFIDYDKVINANPKTFIYIGFPYSKDDKNVYCGTLPMLVKNIDEFKVIKRGESKESSTTTFFLEQHPDYPFIDSKKYEGVVYSEDSKGEATDQKFEGYKLVN